MVVSLNYCSQNGGNLYRTPYYNGNPNIGPRIIGNLDQYPHRVCSKYPRKMKWTLRECLGSSSEDPYLAGLWSFWGLGI